MLYASNDPVDIANPGASAPDDPDARELEVLAHVHAAQPEIAEDTGDAGRDPGERLSQRSIARALGMSVGLTNAILKRLVDKGLLMMRRINQHNVHYLVTPAGIEQIGRRSYLYLRRTIGHVVRYKERLRAFCREQKRAGIRTIRLVGESDLAFLLEWCAQKEGVEFEQVDTRSGAGQPNRQGADTAPRSTRIVYAESVLQTEERGAVLLHEVVLGHGVE